MIYIFADKASLQLEPLTPWNQSYELLGGTGNLLEMANQMFPEEEIQAIAYGKAVKVTTGSHVFINGRLLFPWSLHEALENNTEATFALRASAGLVAVKLEISTAQEVDAEKIEELAKTVTVQEVEIKLAEYIWDYIAANHERLLQDLAHWQFEHHGDVHERAVLVNEEQIHLGQNVKVAPNAVLDASGGPIVLEEGVVIGANSVVLGPLYLAKSVKVNPLSYIRPDSSIGEFCKIGGEVSAAIMLHHSNKQHLGYLGKAYVGSWCNLGAGCSMSNMKNTYSPVSVKLPSGTVATGMKTLGSLIGDHVKIGTNVVLAPATVVGCSSNVFGAGSFPSYINPLSWVEGGKQPISFDTQKAIEIARKVQGKVEIALSAEQEQVLLSLADRNVSATH